MDTSEYSELTSPKSISHRFESWNFIMNAQTIMLDPELQRVLWACYEYWKTEPLPPEDRLICYKWVATLYTRHFGRGFHQSCLRRLAELGFLAQEDTSRGGHRRYYRLVDPSRVAQLLREWNPGVA